MNEGRVIGPDSSFYFFCFVPSLTVLLCQHFAFYLHRCDRMGTLIDAFLREGFNFPGLGSAHRGIGKVIFLNIFSRLFLPPS